MTETNNPNTCNNLQLFSQHSLAKRSCQEPRLLANALSPYGTATYRQKIHVHFTLSNLLYWY
jgi:hypothetical protein